MKPKKAKYIFLLHLVFWPSAAVASWMDPRIGLALIILCFGYFCTISAFIRWVARETEQKDWVDQMRTCSCGHRHWMHDPLEEGIRGECRVPGCGCICFRENKAV